MRLLSVLLISLTIHACGAQEDQKPKSILRPVMQPYILGMSKTEALRYKMMSQLASNIARGEKFTQTEHRTPDGKKYYSKVFLVAPEADTMLMGLKVAFSGVEQELKAYKSPEDWSIMTKYPSIYDTELRDDIIRDIMGQYGSFDDKDTIQDDHDGLVIHYYWRNKEDVDITLKYRARNIMVINDFVYTYSIALEYAYTDQMQSTIDYRKSSY